MNIFNEFMNIPDGIEEELPFYQKGVGGDNAARTLNMSEYEQILLSFADCLRRQESFKFDRFKIITACDAGASAIRELEREQKEKIGGNLFIDQRCYRGDEK